MVEYSLAGVSLVAYVHGGTGGVYGLAQEAASARIFAAVSRAAGAATDLFSSLLTKDVRLFYALVAAAARVVLAPAFLVGLALASVGVIGHAAMAPAAKQAALWGAWEKTRAAETAAQKGMTEEWIFRGEGEARAARKRAGEWDGFPNRTARASGRAGSFKRFPPPVDESDPWDVLGIQRGATKEVVSTAFRRELFKYHPDHAESHEWDAEAATNRTRIIMEAYRTLRKGYP